MMRKEHFTIAWSMPVVHVVCVEECHRNQDSALEAAHALASQPMGFGSALS